MRRLIVLIFCLVVASAGSLQVHAQDPIRIQLEDAPLETALANVRRQADVDLVYADRLITDRTITCTYEGTDLRAVLDCLLKDTGLRAEKVRRRQYVLVAANSDMRNEQKAGFALSGRLVDAKTGERLSGAHVYLTDLKAGTVTNRDGYFVLSDLPRGSYDVRISHLGYRSIDTTLTSGNGPFRLQLEGAPIESEGIVVEAGATRPQENSRLPGMMSVALDRVDRLPSFGEPDLFRALQWTPGIRKTGVVRGGLSVRGGDPDQNLYLLDGAPVYHPWHAFSLISTFQTGTLQSTSLYRGSFPVEHGGRLSTVLDAQMKDGGRKSPKAVAALSVLSGRFRIESPLTSSTSFMLSSRRSYVDKLLGRQHPVTGANGRRDTLRTGYYFFDTSAKLTHEFGPRHRVSLSYYHGRDDLDLRLPFDLSLDFSSWLRPADLLFEVAQNWDNRVLSVQDRYLMAEDVFITSTAYYSSYRAQEASFLQPTTTASLDSDYRVRLHDAGFKVDVDYHESVSHEVQTGLEISTLQFESSLDSDLQRSSGTVSRRYQQSQLGAVKLAGYVQDTWTPTPRWTVEPGLRVSYFSGGDYVRLSPRFNIQYALDPRWIVVEGNAGFHVQYLHRLRDRFSLAYDLVSSRWIPSNDQVQPATGLQLGFGATSHVRPWWVVKLNAYARGTRHYLVPSDVFREKDGIEGPGIEVGALLGQYTDGSERAFGLEVSTSVARGSWNARVGLSTGRTFVRGPTRSGLRWRPSDLDVPLSVRSSVGWQGDQWSTTLAAQVRNGFPTTVPTARYELGDPVEDEPTTYLYRPQVNNGRLPTYLRFDLSVGYEFEWLSANWSVTLDVFNATNRGNVLDQTYQPVPDGVKVNRQRGLPVLPLVELEMEL